MRKQTRCSGSNKARQKAWPTFVSPPVGERRWDLFGVVRGTLVRVARTRRDQEPHEGCRQESTYPLSKTIGENIHRTQGCEGICQTAPHCEGRVGKAARRKTKEGPCSISPERNRQAKTTRAERSLKHNQKPKGAYHLTEPKRGTKARALSPLDEGFIEDQMSQQETNQSPGKLHRKECG